MFGVAQSDTVQCLSGKQGKTSAGNHFEFEFLLKPIVYVLPYGVATSDTVITVMKSSFLYM